MMLFHITVAVSDTIFRYVEKIEVYNKLSDIFIPSLCVLHTNVEPIFDLNVCFKHYKAIKKTDGFEIIILLY